ncbi:peptidoglycan-binding protein [Pseudomonas aeruginosa]|uniref:peptidoglycan-binding domain-containing protein n=1 Tax=Pseudomonas aeruginosa TaxID=287 RepID=UPI001154E50A|nr:hypothetical protein [Pseudomonas aeruginosa]TQH48519.1 hypothetical protein FLI59_32150 [Pseudomonas aeruginosa]
MNFRTKNGYRDLQALVKELGLYTGQIDGVWGKGTSSSTETLLRGYAEVVGKNTGGIGLPTTSDASGYNVITALQRNLAFLGLYSLTVDGIWGNGTLSGLDKAFEVYKERYRTPVYDIAWSGKVSPAFTAKVKDWCGVHVPNHRAPHWLMACMAFETGQTFSPSIKNAAGSEAYGLIQFMSPAANDLNVPLSVIRSMDQLTQLDLVFKYFEMWMKRGKRYTQLEDFYLTIFHPASVGKKADEVLFLQGSKAYLQNKGFDVDKDGKITLGEISSTLYTTYYKGLLPENRHVISY